MRPLTPSEFKAEVMRIEEAKQRPAKQRRSRANARQQKRINAASRELWCSWGQHHTFKHAYLKEQFPSGTICLGCQLQIVSNVETVVEMPALTEAMARQSRERHLRKKQDALMESMRSEADPDSDGWVYYMRINGHIKIGYTKNLRQRSRAYPPGTELLAVEPGTREVEKLRHEQFSRFLAQGREWFAESESLTAHIESLADQHVTPTKLMHSWTKHEGIKHV